LNADLPLIRIRTGIEKCLAGALPDFKRFNARVTKLSEADLPCLNLYFHRDRLVRNQNLHDDREVRFEIEACFKAHSDAESELSLARKRIEDAIEGNQELRNIVSDWSFHMVDFAHEMVGSVRVAALAITCSIEYMRPRLPPSAEFPGPLREVWINREKTPWTS
jgi:hypothetical protein